VAQPDVTMRYLKPSLSQQVREKVTGVLELVQEGSHFWKMKSRSCLGSSKKKHHGNRAKIRFLKMKLSFAFAQQMDSPAMVIRYWSIHR